MWPLGRFAASQHRALTVRVTTNTFFTIGHSTRTWPNSVDLLRELNVDLVVDVRSMPRSRTNPQFNLEPPKGAGAGNRLQAYGGTRRPPRPAAPRRVPAQLILEGAELPELRRLRPDGAICLGAWRGSESRVVSGRARSCARKPSGGAATAASSPTTSSPPAS